MADMLTVRVMMPDRTTLEAEARLLVARTTEGDVGILPGHESCLAALAPSGTLRVEGADGASHTLTVLGGFLTVHEDTVTVLSPVAEHPDRIEALLAERERQKAEKQRSEERARLEIQRAETALRRTLVKNEVHTDIMGNGMEQNNG